MAKGQHLSGYQQKIVKRYYQQLDTIAVQKLSEMISELYLADSEKKKEKLWGQVAVALGKIDAEESRIARVLEKRDVAELAKLVNEASMARPKGR